MIAHITTAADWAQAQAAGSYRAPSLDTEGFIHCSTATQVVPVANAFFRGQPDLVVLVLDDARLGSSLRWEPPAGPPAAGVPADEVFPHVYGPIALAAVVAVVPLVADAVGRFSLSAATLARFTPPA